MNVLRESSYGRYTAVAILLHWAIAVAILGLLLAGWWMHDAIDAEDEATRFLAYQVIQIHKAIGLTVLVLSLLRLVWRLLNPPPPLPSGMPLWQRLASDFSHFCLYGFMIGAPLTGWAMVSSSPEFSALPTSWFGLFIVPHLPVIEAAALIGPAAAQAAPGLAHGAHEILGLLGALLLAVHVGAALKHHYVDQDHVLARMTPGLSPKRPVHEPPAPRAGGLGRGLAGGVLIASVGAFAALFLIPGGQSADSAPRQAARQAAAAGAAPVWTPVMEESRIGFRFTHLGSELTGAFERWSAEIRFDPADLGQSSVQAVIETGSAKTGDSQYDGTLPQADWFDSGAHPEAVFESAGFEAGDGEGAYRAVGTLTLKGQTKDLAIPFTLTIEGDRAEMTGEAVISRLGYDIGKGSDGSASYVGDEVTVALTVVATRGGGGS